MQVFARSHPCSDLTLTLCVLLRPSSLENSYTSATNSSIYGLRAFPSVSASRMYIAILMPSPGFRICPPDSEEKGPRVGMYD